MYMNLTSLSIKVIAILNLAVIARHPLSLLIETQKEYLVLSGRTKMENRFHDMTSNRSVDTIYDLTS